MALCHCAIFFVWRFGCCFVCFWFLFLLFFCFACLVGFFASFRIVTAYWTVYWSSVSTTFAAHHSQDGLITMPELMEHVACQESVWIDLATAKRRLEEKNTFAALGDCLRCFLLLRSLRVFAQVAGFHLDNCIEYFTAPCWPPLDPDSYRSFQPGQKMNHDLSVNPVIN